MPGPWLCCVGFSQKDLAVHILHGSDLVSLCLHVSIRGILLFFMCVLSVFFILSSLRNLGNNVYNI